MSVLKFSDSSHQNAVISAWIMIVILLGAAALALLSLARKVGG